MSVSITWRPAGRGTTVEGGSNDWAILTETFGTSEPMRLEEHRHADKLEAMARVSMSGPYEGLAEALRQHGTILVMGEW